jgi:hypothetical protein
VVGRRGADSSPESAFQPASEAPWLATQLYDDAREEQNWGRVNRVEANSTALHAVFMDAYRNREGLDPVWITK